MVALSTVNTNLTDFERYRLRFREAVEEEERWEGGMGVCFEGRGYLFGAWLGRNGEWFGVGEHGGVVARGAFWNKGRLGLHMHAVGGHG